MDFGFPIKFISVLCCPKDGATLELGQNCQLSKDGGFVRHGTMNCSACNAVFSINNGILDMLGHIALDDESKHEQQLRNKIKESAAEPAWWENEDNYMEIIPTLKALSVKQDETILELGCGDGRYTTILANECQQILAVDFSLASLEILQQRLKESRNVGLVLGDITAMKFRGSIFDHVLSTLVSNLPTQQHRNAMYRLAANALKPTGRFTFSAHNQGVRQIIRGERKSDRYQPGGIYRYNFTVSECKAEVRPYFEKIKATPIQIYFPFARTLRLPLVSLSRFLEHVPLIKGLGNLFCVRLRDLFA